jgi:predicted Zn-dependent peptidase
MMFQGSRNVPKGHHFTLVSERGGVLNGTTSADRTVYFESLPATELPLALWLEADRMRWLDVTPENFENQRKVVQEELRKRVTNAAYAPSRIRLSALVYDDYWPYAHPTIGSMEDLEAAQFSWVVEFHGRYYAPNNAVLALAGDFDPDRAARLIHEYFDAIPKSSHDTPERQPPPKPRSKERVESTRDPHAKTPALYYGWRIPPARTPDHEPLEIASMVLTGGESSRLHQKLVRQLAIARDVTSWTWDRRGPDALALQILLTSDADVGRARHIVDREIHRLAATPVSDAELLRVKNRIRSEFMFRLQSNRTRAIELATFELFWGDARLLARQLQRYIDVDAARLQRAVMTYLGAAGRTVIEVVPDQTASTAEVRP